jgi:hypothetical protein
MEHCWVRWLSIHAVSSRDTSGTRSAARRGEGGVEEFGVGMFDADSDIDPDAEEGGDRWRRVGIRGLQGREEVRGS